MCYDLLKAHCLSHVSLAVECNELIMGTNILCIQFKSDGQIIYIKIAA